jgi:hypothetical protein
VLDLEGEVAAPVYVFCELYTDNKLISFILIYILIFVILAIG